MKLEGFYYYGLSKNKLTGGNEKADKIKNKFKRQRQEGRSQTSSKLKQREQIIGKFIREGRYTGNMYIVMAGIQP